jgi:hypothetical protein
MDPYVEACERLENAGVRYLIVGAFGINLYAGQVGIVITTADCDVMIPPEVPVLAKAVHTLRGLGYSMEAGGATFESLWLEQRRFAIEGATLRVGPLAALVRSKQLAGRPKDHAFLEAHRAALDEMLRRESSESKVLGRALKKKI